MTEPTEGQLVTMSASQTQAEDKTNSDEMKGVAADVSLENVGGDPLCRMSQSTDAYRVALSNLGCRVNRVELDSIAHKLLDAGCQLVGERDAELIIVNSCAVTGEAQAKTRKAVRHAARLPQAPIVMVTGCAATLFPDEFRAIAPNVHVEGKLAIVSRALEALRQQKGDPMASDVACSDTDGIPQGASANVLTSKSAYTRRTRPGIKIQDGCDNHCTFCIVWKARGHSRSLTTQQVLQEVREAQMRGAREVVLTGINLGNFRSVDAMDNPIALPGLLDIILTQTDVERVRLSSIEPPDVTQELLSVMAAAGERVAPFLHVCLQSGCDATLHDMGRVYDTTQYAHMVFQARQSLPDLALGTDLIVGFPGETDDHFAQSLAFCEQMAFSRMHVFRYSKRPGTPAANRPDQLDPHVIAKRSEQMMALAQRMRREQALARVGKEELVMVQYPTGRGVTGGLFDALVDDANPVDTLVHARVKAVLPDGTLDARS